MGKIACQTCLEPGTHPSPSKIACIGCPPGKMSTTGDCDLCTKGKYQNEMGRSSCKWCTERDFSFDGRAGCLDQCPCPTGKFSLDPVPDALTSPKEESTSCEICPAGHRCPRYSFRENVITTYDGSALSQYINCWTSRLGYNYREMTVYNTATECQDASSSRPPSDSTIGCIIGYLSPVLGTGYRPDADTSWVSAMYEDNYYEEKDPNLLWMFNDSASIPDVWDILKVIDPTGDWTNLTTSGMQVQTGSPKCGSETCRPESVYCPAETTDAIIVPSGYFSVSENDGPIERRTGIELCPVGHWCEKGNFTKCQPGKFAPSTGATSCDMCDPGSYSVYWGESSCTNCTEGMQCPRGAIQPVKCGCQANRTSEMNELITIDYDSTKQECPEGWDASERPGDSYCGKNSGSPGYPPKGTFTDGNESPFIRIRVGKPNKMKADSIEEDSYEPLEITSEQGEFETDTPVRQYSKTKEMSPEDKKSLCKPGSETERDCMTGEGVLKGSEYNCKYDGEDLFGWYEDNEGKIRCKEKTCKQCSVTLSSSNSALKQWTIELKDSQSITEDVGATVTQKEWTFEITNQVWEKDTPDSPIWTEVVGAAVTQGSNVGVLSGVEGNVTGVKITAADGVIFDVDNDIVIGSTTIQITKVTNSHSATGTLKDVTLSDGITSFAIDVASGTSAFRGDANIMVGDTWIFAPKIKAILSCCAAPDFNQIALKETKYDVLIVKVNYGAFKLNKKIIRLEIGDQENPRCDKKISLCIDNGNTQVDDTGAFTDDFSEDKHIVKEQITFGGGMKRTEAKDCFEGYRCKQGRDYVCLPGTFAPGTKNSVCKSCPPGSYSNTKGAGSCIHCPKGWFQNAPQQIKCIQCATGQYAEKLEKTHIFTINSREINVVPGVEVLQGENIGTLLTLELTGKTTTTISFVSIPSMIFDEDTTLVLGNTTVPSTDIITTLEEMKTEFVPYLVGEPLCTKCPAGYYAPDTNLTMCTACELGKYQVSESQPSCVHCDPGKDSNASVALADACLDCPIGKHRPKYDNGFDPDCAKGIYEKYAEGIEDKEPEAQSEALDNYEAELLTCQIGFPVCMWCESFSFGCGEYIQPLFKKEDGKVYDKNFKERVRYVTDQEKTPCPGCDKAGYPDFEPCDRCDEAIGFLMKKEGTELLTPTTTPIAAAADDIFFDLVAYPDLDSKMQDTLRNRTNFYANSECVRKAGDEAKGGLCTTCDDGWVSSTDSATYRAVCKDKDNIGDMIAKMVPSDTWIVESFFDGNFSENGIDGDARSMLVRLKIPNTMDHKACNMVQYQLEISPSQDMSVKFPNAENPMRPTVDIPADGQQYDYEFRFQLPNSTVVDGQRKAVATLYEQSYFVRVFPVIEVNNRKKVVDVESLLDPEGRVLSEIFPKKKWSTIKTCGGSDQIYLETRTPENADPGENIDDPEFLNWACQDCPKGGACRGESESHWRTLVAKYGYWRARNLNVSKFAMDDRLYVGRVAFYKCPRPWACLGRKNEEFEDRGWGRKNATYMNSRTPCCDWNFAGTCMGYYKNGLEVELSDFEAYNLKLSEYDLMTEEEEKNAFKLSELSADQKVYVAECEKDYTFYEGCTEVCRIGIIEKNLFLSDETYETTGEICEPNPECKAPDPSLIDHPEKCTDGYIGLTCGNCYDPVNDEDDPCFADRAHTQVGVGTGGQNEILSCDRRKYFMKKGGCEQCPPPRFDVDIGVMIAMFLSIGLGLYIIYKYIIVRLFKFMMKYKVLFNDVKRTFAMILDFLQVLNSISSVISIEFPPIMENFLDSFSGIIAFDIKVIMGMPCVEIAGDGITKYLQEVLMPFMFVTLVLLFSMFNVLRAKSLCPKFCGGRIVVIKKDTGPKVNKLKRKSLAVIQDMQKGKFNAHARHSKKSVTGSGLSALSQTFGNGIFSKEDAPAVQKGVMDMWYQTVNIVWTILSFYHVPIISKSFNMFRCELIEGTWYLNMDYNIACYQYRHYQGILYCMIFIIGFVFGMPGMWAYMLYRNRKKLHTPGMVKQAGYTYVMFHPHAQWYWGTIVNMGRKIVLAGGLIVLYRQKIMQITIGIIYCAGLVVLLQHVRPHKMTSAHWLTTVSWMAIALIYSIPLTKEAIKSSPTPGESSSQILVDYYCIFIIQGTMIAMFGGMFISMHITWLKFKRIQGVGDFDPDDYAWLYLEEKDLKAKAAREHAEASKKSHEKRKSIFGFGGSGTKSSGGKTGQPTSKKAGFKRRGTKGKKVMVAPSSDGQPVDDDPFGLAGLNMSRPNITANQKLPDHLVRRIQDRRGRRDDMNESDDRRREQGSKIIRRRSFDASSMLDFDPNQAKEGRKKKKSRGSMARSGSLKRRPSAKMLAISNDFAQSTSAGDLMIVQPRRKLLGRAKFHKLDPHAEDRAQSKEKKKQAKAEAKKMLEDKRFKVFLSAAERKGYFGDLDSSSDLYKKKYAKLVQKYHEKYDAHKADQSSSSDSSSEDEALEAPKAIMLKTDMPVVNAFGKSGVDLKAALLSAGKETKFESDTVQEI